MDGADQTSHDLPKVQGRNPKGLAAWPQKMQCVLTHGVQIAMFNLLHIVHAGANMAMSCLMRAMQLMQDTYHGVQQTVYLQVDGGSENWNQVLFAWVDLWFDYFPHLQTVIISRLPVGHTHIDVDRLFSYLNGELFGSGGGLRAGKNILTKKAFEESYRTAMAGNKDTMLLNHEYEDINCVYDFWEWLSPHFYQNFSGYGSSGNVHVMRFRRLPDRQTPHIDYKYWHQSSTWLPEDGSSLKVLNSRPNLEDLTELKVERHVDEHEDVLVRSQKPILKWLQEQKTVGMVSDQDIVAWKTYFKSLGKCTASLLCLTCSACTMFRHL